MSLAWGTLVVVVLLLPGILFFAGTYLPEQFTREAEQRSPLGQLAGTLAVSIGVHWVLFEINKAWCPEVLPCVDLALLLETAAFNPAANGASERVGSALKDSSVWIFTYIFSSAGLGILLGASYGSLVARRRIRGLSRHPWVHELSTNGYTYAHILTNIRNDDCVLMYRGILQAFGLQQDGRFAYMVLTGVSRHYLTLDRGGSKTVGDAQPKTMRPALAGVHSDLIPKDVDPNTSRSLFAIEGEDIANAVFDVIKVSAKPQPPASIREMLERFESTKLAIPKDEIDRIVALTDDLSQQYPLTFATSWLRATLQNLSKRRIKLWSKTPDAPKSSRDVDGRNPPGADDETGNQ